MVKHFAHGYKTSYSQKSSVLKVYCFVEDNNVMVICYTEYVNHIISTVLDRLSRKISFLKCVMSMWLFVLHFCFIHFSFFLF